jgi:hypothetical protein
MRKEGFFDEHKLYGAAYRGLVGSEGFIMLVQCSEKNEEKKKSRSYVNFRVSCNWLLLLSLCADGDYCCHDKRSVNS